MRQQHHIIKQHLSRIFDELIRHDGYGEFKVELRILKRGQKEVLIHYGKQYRYVIDFQQLAEPALQQDEVPPQLTGGSS